MNRLAILLLFAAACSSAREKTRENHEEVSEVMAEELVGQLRARTDIRNLRVVVRDFEDHTGAERTHVKRNRVYFSKAQTPREFRQELIEALAPQIRVVDTAAKVQQPPPSDDWGMPTREAVLVGEYSADAKKTVYLRARVIDTESRIVLATSEGIVRK
ncbi:MAG: hypothetical protein ACYTHK_01660 [Planctomycetota bacterium]|jgi:hypothetical protein